MAAEIWGKEQGVHDAEAARQSYKTDGNDVGVKCL